MRTFILGAISGILLSIVAGVAALAVIGHALAVSDPLAKSDVIVAISGDSGPRTATAVELWKDGFAPFILFSGASLDPESVSSAEIMKREAVRMGVPADAILLEPLSATTEENATRTATLMNERGLRTAILVTSPYHQRRASLLFSRAFEPAGLTFRNHPADDPNWDPDRWWLHRASRALTIVELAKLGAALLFG
ncbi:MAG TPA: YdcF family protein [Candidatus Limnocylindrales bacterium]|nr:YdcF family protein [Candidatus Limnocylindrales bacterium]